MRSLKLIPVVLAAFLLSMPAYVGATTASAQQEATKTQKAEKTTRRTAKAAAPTRHQATGEVTSVSDTSLTITQARTKKELTFSITPETKKHGEIAQGKHVRVYYTEANGQLTATAIRVLEARKPAPAKAPKKKASS
jgi:Cu/Ag efflux protein CusF